MIYRRLMDLVDGRLVLGFEAEVDSSEDDEDKEGIVISKEDVLQSL
jgi:hypothetical protein